MDVDVSGGMGEQEEAERGEEQLVEQDDGEKENERREVIEEEEKKAEEEEGGQDVEVEVVESGAAGGASGSGVVDDEVEASSRSVVDQAPQALQQGPATPSVQPNSHHQHQQHQVVPSPRPAPAYRVVAAVIEKRDDGPGPRCGHTLTAVAAVGEEGSPGYIGPRLILFGGATALEGSSATGPQAASPGAGIRMFLPHFSSL